jgi:hypothetical protein
MFQIKLLVFFIFISTALQAQNDFFILKRKNKTIAQYYTDSHIKCELVDQQWVDGNIKTIRHDSVFIETFEIHYLPTIWGTYMPDTVRFPLLKIPIKDIIALPAYDKSKVHGVPSLPLVAQALQVGGAGYDALNAINTLANKDPLFASNNIGRLIGGAVVFMIGKFIQLAYCSPVAKIGKKYHLEYMGSNTSSQ